MSDLLAFKSKQEFQDRKAMYFGERYRFAEIQDIKIPEDRLQFLKYGLAIENSFLLIQGPNLCGKTHLCAALYEELHDCFSYIDYVKAPYFCDPVFNFNREDLKNCPLVILDDLGQESYNEFYVDELIEHRYNNNLSMIFSTTFDKEAINRRYGQRIGARILSSKNFSFIGSKD